MTTTGDMVSRAFRKLAVSSEDTALTAHEINTGVDTLNMMMHEWKLSSVDTSHVGLAAGDTFPLDSEFEFGTVYMLAKHLSPDYVVPASFDAESFFRRIQAAYMVIAEVTMPNALIYVPSQRENLTGQAD